MGFAFVEPWALGALVVLPALWWLLRLVPPPPRVVRFPAIVFLLGLVGRQDSAERAPPWLIALRLTLAAVLVLAFARPVLNAAGIDGPGPLLLVVDDGWAAGKDWALRQRALEDWIERAERGGRPVLMIGTARRDRPQAPGLLRPAEARETLRHWLPSPWPTDRLAALGALPENHHGQVVWLADGLDDGQTEAVLGQLRGRGPLTVLAPPPERRALRLRPQASREAALVVEAERVAPGPSPTRWLVAHDERGHILVREPLRFAEDAKTATARLDLPGEWRNRLTRLTVEGEDTAGAVLLADERWRRRAVGLVSGDPTQAGRPLLGDLYYLERALAPFAETRLGTIRTLLERELSLLVLADSGRPSDDEKDILRRWMDRGGVLVRFAGPRLAAAPDDLLPVRLRVADRALGGAVSWSRPIGLGDFPKDSPFAGLPLAADVTVSRQILAQPTPELTERTWARLGDGTPLVTAERRGQGWLVLVHVTAHAEWSNLPLSGLFVDMLRRMLDLGRGHLQTETETPLPAAEVLDGLGRLRPAGSTVQPLSAAQAAAPPGPGHPPGFYGEGNRRRAYNLGPALAEPIPLPADVGAEPYGASRAVALLPALLVLALLLFAADGFAALHLRGLLRWTVGIAVGLALGGPAAADPAWDIKAARQMHLAHVLTGEAAVDRIAAAGLVGLTHAVNQRTAVELAVPMAIDIERDELAFFPLLYWPVTRVQAPPSPDAAAKLNAFLRGGGTIVLDTRGEEDSPDARLLTRDLAQIRLVPAPADHLLTRSFYLIDRFPGRWAGGTVWVEEAGVPTLDGVSPWVIGTADWASAWAVDEGRRPLYVPVPGGERQRETALRFGINLVVYVLTGTYKSDQVHVPHILQRLGR